MRDTSLSILIIDDDAVYRHILKNILNEKFNVWDAETPTAGFRILSKEKIDIIICDYLLPELNGLRVLEKVKTEYPETEFIMISSSGDMDTVIDALRKGAADFLKKGNTPAEIWLSIERTKKLSDLKKNLLHETKRNSMLKAEVERDQVTEIIGKSPLIKDIKNQIELVARTPDTSVLILGESGTGKELVARSIHEQSSRKDEFFGAVNMSAIPESLFESEFFGHKKGSFTGALSDKAGWFETANGGTLFFDEIGEMSMMLQVKLLRVLEDRKFTKVGTQQEQKFDIRIIAATNKTVEEITNGKIFRLDLLHRLSTFIIQLPTLHERNGDLKELSYYFLNKLSNKLNKNITKINNSVFEMLISYSFPGNIRELKNLIERAVIICQGNELLPHHFSSIGIFNHCSVNNGHKIQTLDLKELEKQTIITALQKSNGNISEAARLMNLEWNALYRRINKYNIVLPVNYS